MWYGKKNILSALVSPALNKCYLWLQDGINVVDSWYFKCEYQKCEFSTALRKGIFTFFQNVNGLYSETHKPVEKLRTLIEHKCYNSFHIKSWFPTTWWNYLKTFNKYNIEYKYCLPIPQF